MRGCPRCSSIYSEDVEFCGLDGERLVEQTSDLLIGQVVDRYHVTARLGAGAMGCVYRARHTRLDRDFAIKVLFGEMAANKKVAARFHREAKAASRMNHANIVAVLDFGTTEAGLSYLAMELIEGRSLSDAIAADGRFDHPRAAAMIREIASGLAEAHRLGFIHRDLKPGNIMLDPQPDGEHPKILDFGLVAMAQESGAESKLTRTGYTLGTPAYMAPEQAQGQKVGPAADLYGLGCIGYELLTGRTPFEGPIQQVMIAKLSQAPPPMPTTGPLEELVWSMLAIDPARRPPSAVAVVQAIEIMEGVVPRPVSAAPGQAVAPTGEAVHPSNDSAVAATAVRLPSAAAEASPMTPLLIQSQPAHVVPAMASVAVAAQTAPERSQLGSSVGAVRPPSSWRRRAIELGLAVVLIVAGVMVGEMLVPRDDAATGPRTAQVVAGAAAPAGEPAADPAIEVARSPTPVPAVAVTPDPGVAPAAIEVAARPAPAPTENEVAATPAPAAAPRPSDAAAVRAARVDSRATVDKPAARSSRTIQRRKPPAIRPAPPPAAKPQSFEKMEASIAKEAARRGLSVTDLMKLPAVVSLLTIWRSDRAGMSPEGSNEALVEIRTAIRTAPISGALLNAKLDEVAKRLDVARTTAPADVYQKLENRYLDLSAELRNGLSNAESTRLARSISKLGRDVSKAQAGR